MLKGRDLRRAAVTTPGVMTEERFQRLAELAATAMDGSSGMAFVGAALELIRPGLIEPLSVVTHPRDITVTFGGGFVEYLSAYAADYGSVGFNQYGLQGTNNTDIPQVQVTVDKGTWKAVIWAASSSISDIDMKKLAAATASGQGAPFSLQKLIDTGVRLVWNKALDKVTYTGWLGLPGLLNNPDVVATLAPATGAGGLRTWASKTPQQIQTDINFGLLAGVKASGYSLEGLPDRSLCPRRHRRRSIHPRVRHEEQHRQQERRRFQGSAAVEPLDRRHRHGRHQPRLLLPQQRGQCETACPRSHGSGYDRTVGQRRGLVRDDVERLHCAGSVVPSADRLVPRRHLASE
jgi:hypothetical protein